MAKKTTKKRSAADMARIEKAALENLHQATVAWLLGVDPRDLRGRIDIPRKPNGRYDASAAVVWIRNRINRPKITDVDQEKLLIITDYVAGELSSLRALRTIVKQFRELRECYGEFALVEFAETLVEVLRAVAENNPPPSLADEQRAQREERRHQAEIQARDEMRTAVVCEHCARLRRGDKWLARKKPPADFLVVTDICPNCQT